jgi:PPE-repeat protein
MANNLIERDMRERLFALAAAWLELAGELERQAAEYEELLSALRLHFSGASVSPTKH